VPTINLTQDQISELLEGHQNVLTPLAKKEEEFLARCPCPSCGGTNLSAYVNAKKPFSSGSVLPNKLLHCAQCDVEFEPHTGIITKAPPTSVSG
jgi:hypothetical protein